MNYQTKKNTPHRKCACWRRLWLPWVRLVLQAGVLISEDGDRYSRSPCDTVAVLDSGRLCVWTQTGEPQGYKKCQSSKGQKPVGCRVSMHKSPAHFESTEDKINLYRDGTQEWASQICSQCPTEISNVQVHLGFYWTLLIISTMDTHSSNFGNAEKSKRRLKMTVIISFTYLC